mmetsp:Transcript_26000/g.36121  ORF Transcript_26000/g.36121 Transcript_26000/m.36121 type:complete len:209 (-) Transcript_26000:1199-1825(-)
MPTALEIIINHHSTDNSMNRLGRKREFLRKKSDTERRKSTTKSQQKRLQSNLTNILFQSLFDILRIRKQIPTIQTQQKTSRFFDIRFPKSSRSSNNKISGTLWRSSKHLPIKNIHQSPERSRNNLSLCIIPLSNHIRNLKQHGRDKMNHFKKLQIHMCVIWNFSLLFNLFLIRVSIAITRSHTLRNQFFHSITLVQIRQTIMCVRHSP